MWGEFSNLPFTLALEREPWSVCDSERRAMELMRSLVDDIRFRAYAWTGLIYARGNLTGKTYRIEHNTGHGAGIYELNDGLDVGYWCTMPGEAVPPTDHVLAMKNMIEGEEAVFRTTGNRSTRDHNSSHFGEGLQRNFAAVEAEPLWETSICGDRKSERYKYAETFFQPGDQRVHDIGVMVYRDTYFEPMGLMTDQFGLKDNDDLLRQDTIQCRYNGWPDYNPASRRTMERVRPILGDFDGIQMRVCRTNDLYPYEGEPTMDNIHLHEQGFYDLEPVNYPGPRLEDANAVCRFNDALRIGGNAVRVAAPDCMGLCLNNVGASYHQGFADGMRTARPERQPLPPSIEYRPYNMQIGCGNYPLLGQNYGTITATNCTNTLYFNSGQYQIAVDEPGERATNHWDRLYYADEMVRMKMTEPQETYEEARMRKALEIEL